MALILSRMERDRKGRTVLHKACESNSTETLKSWLKECEYGLINQQDFEKNTALHYACRNGSLKCVKLLLTAGMCDIGILNRQGRTPLQEAVNWRKHEIVNYLDSINVKKPAGILKRITEQAFLEGDTDLINYLIIELKLDISGYNVLEQAVYGGDMDLIKYLLIEREVDVKEQALLSGALEVAVRNGDMSFIKYLVMDRRATVDETVMVEEVLELTVCKGDLSFIKYLVGTKQKLDVGGVINKAGCTLLCLASANGHSETFKYLVEVHRCDPRPIVHEDGDMPLFLECSGGHLDWVKALINKHVNLSKAVNRQGETAIFVAYKESHWKVVKFLANTHHCDTRHCLLHAVENDNVSGVKVLLNDCHASANATNKQGRTLLDLAKVTEIIILLLKHGAKADNVYHSHNKVIGNLSSQRPPDNPLHIFITGDGGVGKSTLLKSMLSSKGFWANFSKPKPVTGVDEKTVGIIPHEIVTKEFGKVIYYDFAGQQEFYASHCAVLENAVHTSPPIIIYLAHLRSSEKKITDSTVWWMSLVQNQCTNLTGTAHVIVVGSHADKVKEIGENPRDKESMFAPIIKKFSKLEFIAFTPMDCRFPDSDQMKEIKKQIQRSSAILRSPETVSLNAHTFYIYLLDTFKDSLAVSMKDVKQRIHSDLDSTQTRGQSKKARDILFFIPTTLSRLVEICNQLNQKGLILYLHNDASPEKSFIVCDQVTLLSQVTGTVFAPENFRQHCKLASSTGVVPFSKFTAAFRMYDVEMLTLFISHLELCFEILDKEVLDCVRKVDENPEPDSRYLFFPALIRIDYPESVWSDCPNMKYHFGWIVECSRELQFFNPRCLQVLILRIVFTFGLAPTRKNHEGIPSLQRYCSVWKSGICWCSDDGIASYLELSENGKSFILKLRSNFFHHKILAYRFKIINKVLKTIADYCPSISKTEIIDSVIDPSQVVCHPLPTFSCLTLFSIKHDITPAIMTRKKIVNSLHLALPVKCLLQFEPYFNLDQETLQCIHSEENVMKDEKISNTFVSHFANQLSCSEDIAMYIAILEGNQDIASQQTVRNVSSRQKLIQALKLWRDTTEGSYSYLRETLNTYSIFSGRNPLEIAEIPFEASPEDRLPAQQELAVCLPRSRDSLKMEELQKETHISDCQLDTKIREVDLYDIAGCFDCVEKYLDKLGLTVGQQTQVEELAERRDIQTAMTKALKFWYQPNPLSATYRALLQILLDLKRGDVAVRVCQYINEEIPRNK